MSRFVKLGRIVAAIGFAVGVAGAAMATPTGLNVNLDAGWNPPGNNGQPNGAFAEFDNGTLELGLRAQTRFQGPITPDGGNSNSYTVNAGLSAGLTSWNFDFSALIRSPATNLVTLGSLDVLRLGIFDGIGGTQLEMFDFLPAAAALPIAQDSWNPGFPFIGLAGINNSAYAYWIVLGAVDNGIYMDTNICVHTAGTVCEAPPPPVVPEPGTIALFGAALAGLGLVRRRRFA